MNVFKSVGIGFGPSNIALAIALEERGMVGGSSGHIFFDGRSEPDWHPGLMYEEATMQISFLKDLISMVNPRSRYTFLNYIHASGRVHEFINLRTFYPRRTEFESYVKWCAGQLGSYVEFNNTVRDVWLTHPQSPATSDLTVSVASKTTGQTQEIRTQSWPLSNPSTAFRSVFHSGQTLHRLAGGVLPQTERNLSFVNFRIIRQRVTGRIDHRTPQLVKKKPCSFITPQAKLSLKLESGNPIGMAGQNMVGVKPGSKRKMTAVHEGSVRH